MRHLRGCLSLYRMKRILIECVYCDGKPPAGYSPAQVEELITNAVESMRPFLRTMQIQLDVRHLRLAMDEMELAGTIRINGRKVEACAGEKLSLETLTDAILKETARFKGGCAGDPEDLHR